MPRNEFRPSVPEDWFVDPVRLGVPGLRPAVDDGNPLSWQTDVPNREDLFASHGGGFNENTTNLTYGLGAEYGFTRNVAVRGEWQRYTDLGGGGFGAKAGMLAEHTVVIGAARRLGRPLSWVETRTENLVSMPQGRGQVGYYEMGLTRDGTMVGLRARVIGDSGAYAGFGGALPLHMTYLMAPGVYAISNVRYDAAAALLPDGDVLVAGGYDDTTTAFQATAERYHPASKT